jgi:hypothetical protein
MGNTDPYPRNPHGISPTARLPQTVKRVVSKVEAEGGRASFRLHGRRNRERLEEIKDALPHEYAADLVWFDSDSPAGVRRRKKREMWLYVQRADLAGPREINEGSPTHTDLIAQYGKQVEAEKARFRREYPGWRHNSDPPHTPGN